MAEADEVREYYAKRNRLILLEAKLHDAFCKITENAYWDSSGACDIHPAIVHPEWTNIKDRIYPSLMIWQIAYMVCPFRDVWHSNNPIVGGYFSERWNVMYEIIDCIECGYIKNYQLPPEISNPSQLETTNLDYKVRIKVHFNDLAAAIRSGGFSYWNSKWIRLWVAHSTRSKKPKLPFSPPPEPIHVQGIFNEKSFFLEIEGKPFELEEVTAPEWTGIKQTYADSFTIWQEKYRHRNIHPVFENQLEWLERNLNTERVIEIQPMYMAGDPKPPTYKLGENRPITIPTTTAPLTKIQDNLPVPRVDELEAEILKLEAKLQEMEAEWSELLDPFFSEPEPKQKTEKRRYVPKPTGARPETLENLERWHSEIKRLYGTSRKFKYHSEICRRIASSSGETAKYEHIRKQTRDYFRQLKPKENNQEK